MLVAARTQVDLRDGIQPARGGGIEQGGELHPVPHRDAERLHQLAPRRPFPGQRLDHARKLRPPQAQQGTGHQLGDPAAFGRGGAVRPRRDPGVEPLDELHAGIGEQRPEQAGDEMRTPLGEVGIDEDQQVTLGHEERLPQRFALAGIAAELRRDVAGPVHGRVGLRGRGRGPVGRIRIDDHHLIDQRYPLHQGLAERADHARDGALLVARGNHHADARARPPLALQQHLGRPVPPMPGPPAVPRLRAAVHPVTPWPLPRLSSAPLATTPGTVVPSRHFNVTPGPVPPTPAHRCACPGKPACPGQPAHRCACPGQPVLGGP